MWPNQAVTDHSVDGAAEDGVLCQRHRAEVGQEQARLEPVAHGVQARHGRGHADDLRRAQGS